MKFYRLSDATFYDPINTIRQFIKPFLDKKCLFFRGIRNLEGGKFADNSGIIFFSSPLEHMLWVLI